MATRRSACNRPGVEKTPVFVAIVVTTLTLYLCGFSFLAVDADQSGGANKGHDDRSEKHPVGKSREHIDQILRLKARKYSNGLKGNLMRKTLVELLDIYTASVKPLEHAYRFLDLTMDALLEAEVMAKPLLLLIGPWSTGKTTLINYLLGLEDSHQRLVTGAEPTTSDFMVLLHGKKYNTMKGMQLATDESKAFASLEKMGLTFLEKFVGIEMPSPLLELITIVDTPGIIENRKQQERGYPFNDVMHWFIQRASLIFLVFDPTKLEVGSELEIIFNQIKGHQGKVRIVLNKADTVQQQELMKVYGGLFWSLAPLMHSVEPPRVYMGSFWSNSKTDHPMASLFMEEEIRLLEDLNQAIENQVENKISYVRRHALLVRLHALTVDSFINVFHEHKSLIWDNNQLWTDILHSPGKYGVFQRLLKHLDVSKHDLPNTETYVRFFTTNNLGAFLPLTSHCALFHGCDIDRLNKAVHVTLPGLLNRLKATMNQHCSKENCK